MSVIAMMFPQARMSTESRCHFRTDPLASLQGAPQTTRKPTRCGYSHCDITLGDALESREASKSPLCGAVVEGVRPGRWSALQCRQWFDWLHSGTVHGSCNHEHMQNSPREVTADPVLVFSPALLFLVRTWQELYTLCNWLNLSKIHQCGSV